MNGVDLSITDLVVLNGALALMMFGASLDLRPADFIRVITAPRIPAAALVAQFVLLPGATSLITWVLGVPAELALGMILVASCPGGTFSNVLAWLGRGNVALSVSLTAVSSLAAVVLTPLNFSLYGWLNPVTRPLLTGIEVSGAAMLLLVLAVLGLPMMLGMVSGMRFPHAVGRIRSFLRSLALTFFLGFVALALFRNFHLLQSALGGILPLVMAHNLLALGLGAACARLAGAPVADRRAITLEVGIQNSALGLGVLFTFFPGAALTILVAATWGVWHLVSGLLLVTWWSRAGSRDAASEVAR